MGRDGPLGAVLLTAALLACSTMAGADVTVSLASYQYLPSYTVWQYTYTIDNTTGSDYAYYIELDPVDTATISGFPSGWTDTFADTSIGGYVSWSAPSTSDWVAPGNTLSGFVIESPYGPGVDYSVWGTALDADGSWGGDTSWAEGLIDGPHIPEPATWLLLTCGLGALLRRCRRG